MSYYESLQHQLHYTFHDTHLLEEAFIADGAVNSRNDLDGPPSGNKILALIGDAVLQDIRREAHGSNKALPW